MAQRTVHRRRPGHPNTKRNEGQRPMEIGPQRASILAESTAPQIVPPSASGLPSLCLKCEKRVAQSDFRLHTHQLCSNASRSVNQVLPRRPRGAYFVVLSSGACKVPCWLVSSQFTINRSSQAPFRCSDCPCARWSSLPILCLLVIVEIHTRIIEALMFGDRNLVRLTFRLATDISITFSF